MTIKINFLTPKGASSFYLDVFKAPGCIILLIVGFVLFFWHVSLQQKISAEIKRHNYFQQELQKLVTKIDEGINAKDRLHIDTKQKLVNFLVDLEKKRSSLVRFFAALHRGVSNNVSFTRILIKDGKIELLGQTSLLTDLIPLITGFLNVREGGCIPTIQKITKQEGSYGFSLSSCF